MEVHEFEFFRAVVGGAELVVVRYQPDMVVIFPAETVSSVILLEQSWVNIGTDEAPVFKTVRDIVLEQINQMGKLQ